MQNISCNLCGIDTGKLLFESKDLLYGVTNKVFRVVRCTRCSLVYLNPQPEGAEIATFYPNTYRPYKIDDSTISYALPKEPKKNVLDVGCGSGDLLVNIAKKHPDWALYGLDFDARAVHIARSFGFNIFHGSLPHARYENNFFDEIHMNHVLEHTPNPRETVEEAARILKDTGELIIITPNFRSLSRIIFRNYWYHIDTPRHLFLFTPKTLRAVLKRAGLKKIKFQFILSPKYFLQSYALLTKGKKQRYARWIWKLFVIPAR